VLEIGAFEAKNTLGSLLDRVEHGEEIVITRYGKAVARLVPNTGALDHDQARAAVARINRRVQSLGSSPVAWEDLKAERDLGRP
jgi:prevent-host-death family protein